MPFATISDDKCNIPVEELTLTRSTYNTLKRAQLNTLGELISAYENKQLLRVRNLGKLRYIEILNAISEATDGLLSHYHGRLIDKTKADYTVPPEIENISVWDMRLSYRTCKALNNAGYNTAGKIIRMTNEEVDDIQRLGRESISEMNRAIDKIKSEGIRYFEKTDPLNEPIDKTALRTVDKDTVQNLTTNFGFKTSWLKDIYGVSRARANEMAKGPLNHGNWLNREFTEEDRQNIDRIIKEKKTIIYTEKGDVIVFLNNLKDDCAIILAYIDEIKCFYLRMLPGDVQKKITDERMDCLLFREFEFIYSGQIVSILKEEYFIPNDSSSFKFSARKRGMSIDEYSVFLTGKHFRSYYPDRITDDKIIDYLSKNCVNGKLKVLSRPIRCLDKGFHAQARI